MLTRFNDFRHNLQGVYLLNHLDLWAAFVLLCEQFHLRIQEVLLNLIQMS